MVSRTFNASSTSHTKPSRIEHRTADRYAAIVLSSAILANSNPDIGAAIVGLLVFLLGVAVAIGRRSIADRLERTLRSLGADAAADLSTPTFLLVWGVVAAILGGASAVWIFSMT